MRPCTGLTDLFFSTEEADLQAARTMCRRCCPERLDCLERSLVDGEAFGVFGGLTADDRRRALQRARQSLPRGRPRTPDALAVAVVAHEQAKADEAERRAGVVRYLEELIG